MKLFIFSLIFSLASLCQIQESDFDIIQNPALSKRCKALIADRNDKIIVSQKLKSILQRNEVLTNKLRKGQKLLEQKLMINKSSTQRELSLALTQIQRMEENIVRSGCPGVSL